MINSSSVTTDPTYIPFLQLPSIVHGRSHETETTELSTESPTSPYSTLLYYYYYYENNFRDFFDSTYNCTELNQKYFPGERDVITRNNKNANAIQLYGVNWLYHHWWTQLHCRCLKISAISSTCFTNNELYYLSFPDTPLNIKQR